MTEEAVKDPSEPRFWRERWQSGETRWDMGRAYPWLGELLDAAWQAELMPDGVRVLEPGCGRAHTGAALAGLGYEVTSFDVVPEAIAQAHALYAGVEGLTLTTGNALAIIPEWRGAFHGVFDRAMLCALPPPVREEYARALFAHLAPGGAILSSVVTERRDGSDGGPPFAVSPDALIDMLDAGFERVYMRKNELDPESEPRVKAELLTVWRRRDAWREGR